MEKTAFVYHPDMVLHDAGPTHPERPDRIRAIMTHLDKTGFLDRLLLIEPGPADEAWITRVHPLEHVRLIEKAASEAPATLDADTRVSKESFRVAKLAIGSALTAVDAVMEGKARNAFAAVRPPGHHASATRAMGFCLFNNVAVAARYIQEKYDPKRILIVDWDVHHGNGTQNLFYADPSVLFFSTHQSPCYPGTGAEGEMGTGQGKGFTVNAPLSAGAGDKEIVRAFRDKLVPAAEKFHPEFVLSSSGFDGHKRDPLAELRLTEAGFAELTRIVMEIAGKSAKGQIVSLLEGGYDLEGLSRSVEAHLQVLAGI